MILEAIIESAALISIKQYYFIAILFCENIRSILAFPNRLFQIAFSISFSIRLAKGNSKSNVIQH